MSMDVHERYIWSKMLNWLDHLFTLRKGNRKKLSNCGGITLLNISDKSISHTKEYVKHTVTEPTLEDTQCGFHTDGNTTVHTLYSSNFFAIC